MSGSEVGTGVAGTSVGRGVGDGGREVGVAGTFVGEAGGDVVMDCPAQPTTASNKNKAPRGRRWVFTKVILLRVVESRQSYHVLGKIARRAISLLMALLDSFRDSTVELAP
jgi:hypothetical protein